MVQDLIGYDLLVQEAGKGIIRKVLTNASRQSLPGDHHFCISFLTAHPGVRISSRLLEKYPHEMTIVIQHQFWDLHVGETAFEIGLSFSNVPERLHISFDAITGFFDPSVKFGLQFEPIVTEAAPAPIQLETDLTRKAREEKAREATRTDQETILGAEEVEAEKANEAASSKKKIEKPKADKTGSAEVVSLDAFRKK